MIPLSKYMLLSGMLITGVYCIALAQRSAFGYIYESGFRSRFCTSAHPLRSEAQQVHYNARLHGQNMLSAASDYPGVPGPAGGGNEDLGLLEGWDVASISIYTSIDHGVTYSRVVGSCLKDDAGSYVLRDPPVILYS